MELHNSLICNDQLVAAPYVLPAALGVEGGTVVPPGCPELSDPVAEAQAQARAALGALAVAEEKLQTAYREIEDLRRANTHLLRDNAGLREQAVTDPTTADGELRISNRLALDQALGRAEADPETEIIVFDANNFGTINKITEYGQEAGDDELRRIVRAIRIACASQGIGNRSIFRRGGDEIVVFAPKGRVEHTSHDPHTGKTSCEVISTGEAVVRQADRLYGTRRFAGTYGDHAEPLMAEVSLSGSTGNTFAEADRGLQAAKQARKAQGSGNAH